MECFFPAQCLQQLMESYFKYCYNKKYNENGLLFSEKHLCNDCDFGSPFFSRICDKEIARLNKVILNGTYIDNHDEIVACEMLGIRKKRNYQTKIELLKDEPIELLFYNDAVDQLGNYYAAVYRIRKNFSLRCVTFSWHFSSLLAWL